MYPEVTFYEENTDFYLLMSNTYTVIKITR